LIDMAFLTAVLVAFAAIQTSLAAPTPEGTLAKRGTGKRGLAYNNAAMTKFFGTASNSKVSWMYDWGQTAGSGANSALKYCPMLWGLRSQDTANWVSNANAAISAGADTLLYLNEPDLSSQANVGVSAAVAGFKQYMQPFAGKVKLSAPAVTNGAAPMGLAYLQSFISSCTGCQIDVVPIHWYDSATNVAYFKAYIPQAYAAGGNRPLWITEFGASGTDAQVVAFLKEVLPWLDSLSYVQRYSYFYDGPSTDSTGGNYLVNSAGNGATTVGTTFDTY
jgi:Glycosyl hydrolase catalytic core